MSFDEPSLAKAEQLLRACRTKGLQLAVAESCTGGLLAACITEIAGASDVFLGGIVSYSNEAKHELLGIAYADIEEFGAVSEQASREMAYGASLRFNCKLTASITGIAGPNGGSDAKPVGMVHIAIACHDAITHKECHFKGNRSAIRLASVGMALDMLLEAANGA